MTMATKVNGQGALISPAWVTMNKVIMIAIMLNMVTLIFLISFTISFSILKKSFETTFAFNAGTQKLLKLNSFSNCFFFLDLGCSEG